MSFICCMYQLFSCLEAKINISDRSNRFSAFDIFFFFYEEKSKLIHLHQGFGFLCVGGFYDFILHTTVLCALFYWSFWSLLRWSQMIVFPPRFPFFFPPYLSIIFCCRYAPLRTLSYIREASLFCVGANLGDQDKLWASSSVHLPKTDDSLLGWNLNIFHTQ